MKCKLCKSKIDKLDENKFITSIYRFCSNECKDDFISQYSNWKNVKKIKSSTKTKKANNSKYKEIYLKSVNKIEWDIILCEITWKPATDIHHIIYRSQWWKDIPENLIALSREAHDRAHFKKKPYLKADRLLEIAKKRIEFYKKF